MESLGVVPMHSIAQTLSLNESNPRYPHKRDMRQCRVCGEKYNADQFGKGREADVCSVCARKANRSNRGWR
jgi:formylmethanofuran dehydrogenase subunit E